MELTLSPTVQVDFALAVGTGRLDASLHVPSNNVTLTQLLPVLQSLSNSIVSSAVDIIHNEGYEISCRAGCGACCRQLVPLSVFEAESLAEWIRSLPLDQQQALEQRFHAALVALNDAGILARLDPSNPNGHHDQQLAVDYLATKTPCPFLINESCGIHPIRPLICREYLVTSPPEFCVDPSTKPVVGVPLPVKLSKVIFKLGAQLEHDPRGWIPLVFLFSWMQSGTRPGDAIHGPGPELLYEVLKRLTEA